ncbi:hypothetical protein CEXT_169531 [Caerostris extrusa]|uniref:Uncharacterized protein n=1 Tax=Caerostris extrusa TaxID=172846 RepID=A0AAV4XJ22_CAEEX|nr:hypothetical protein CEXT_169531 [Caerostris extrusa]
MPGTSHLASGSYSRTVSEKVESTLSAFVDKDWPNRSRPLKDGESSGIRRSEMQICSEHLSESPCSSMADIFAQKDVCRNLFEYSIRF